MELRVDLLESWNPASVLEQLAVLRKHTDNMPVIFTIRSKSQCGAWPDDAGEELFQLARWGLRAGVEYLDVEANWPMEMRESLIREAREKYPATVLIGSYHVVGRRSTDEDVKRLFLECLHPPELQLDGSKVVTTAYDERDAYRIHAAAESLALPVPYIGVCLTPRGKLSRVLNSRFTPVTHDKLPSVAAPGQMTSEAIMEARRLLGMLPDRKFHLFGHPISASPSPRMHNAGFKATGLAETCEYSLCEGEDPAVMGEAMAAPDFGGASVTIPHKQNVLQFLDSVSPAAKAIGAVNTVVVMPPGAEGNTSPPDSPARQLRGENTDWLGILRPVRRRLREKEAAEAGAVAPPRGSKEGDGKVALVVGAGGAAMGACYAMQQLGLEVLVFNRSPEKAAEVALRFNAKALTELSPESVAAATGGAARVDVVVSTVPGAAEFTLPPALLQSKPVVFDAAYKPAKTALLAQAVEAGCPVVQGAEMLVEQGLEQFQLWTGRRAPRDRMAAAVFDGVERLG